MSRCEVSLVTFTIGFPMIDMLIAVGAVLAVALVLSAVRESWTVSPAGTLTGTGIVLAVSVVLMFAGVIVLAELPGQIAAGSDFLARRYHVDRFVSDVGGAVAGLGERFVHAIEDWRILLDL